MFLRPKLGTSDLEAYKRNRKERADKRKSANKTKNGGNSQRNNGAMTAGVAASQDDFEDFMSSLVDVNSETCLVATGDINDIALIAEDPFTPTPRNGIEDIFGRGGSEDRAPIEEYEQSGDSSESDDNNEAELSHRIGGVWLSSHQREASLFQKYNGCRLLTIFIGTRRFTLP
ncbi:MAG: hypothetical protein SGPRY_007323 [Prymnesium sp.]